MNNFISANHSAIVSMAGFLIFILVVWYLVSRFLDLDEEVRKKVHSGFRVFLAIFFIGYAFYFIAFASVNNIPRSVIDRSVLEQQIKENRARSATNR